MSRLPHASSPAASSPPAEGEPVEGRYLEALTHSSFAHENGGSDYERLEFLGDSVLQLCVSRLLLTELPDAPPGVLTDARQWLVKNTRLAQRARELNLGSGLRLGRGAGQQGDATQVKVLADVFEAMLGALFLHQGLQACQDVVDAAFGEEVRAARGNFDRVRNPKMVFQEWVQAQHRGTPIKKLLVYEEIRCSGPAHDALFEMEARVLGEPMGRGQGTSKGDAQAMAALDALRRLGLR